MELPKLLNNNKLLVKNISYLALFQGINYILPIVIIPYLIKIIGIENFGLVSLAQAIVLYINVLVEYGFNFSATKFISRNRKNKRVVNKTLSTVLVLKLFFLIVVFLFFLILIFNVPILRKNAILYLSGYSILLGMAIFPIWFFQGIEKLKHITYANLIGKIIIVILIFTLIKNQGDYIHILFIYALGSIITGFLGLFFIRFNGYSFGRIGTKDLKYHLSKGYTIFISSIGISLYRNMNILLVGIFTNNTITGVYSVSEKVIKSVQMLTNPVAQAIFPSASKKISEIPTIEGKKYIQKLLRYMFWLFFFIFIIALVISPLVSKFFFKEYNELFFIIFIILSPVIIFGGLNYIVGIVGLINFGKDKLFTKAIYTGAIVNLIAGIIGGYFFGVYGISSALLIAEIVVFFKLRKYLNKV